MKVIKKGKPYRIHKCSKCKTKFAYKFRDYGCGTIIHCPECDRFLDSHLFDRKISRDEYDKLGG